MKVEEIRALKSEELAKQLEAAHQELFDLRFRLSTAIHDSIIISRPTSQTKNLGQQYSLLMDKLDRRRRQRHSTSTTEDRPSPQLSTEARPHQGRSYRSPREHPVREAHVLI